MTEPSSTGIEALKIITNFLSDKSPSIIILVLLIICRKSISDLISRLTSFSFDNGDSKIGMEAAAPFDENRLIKEHISTDEKPAIEESVSHIDETEEGVTWGSEMHNAFTEGRFDDADKAFKKYALDENDEAELHVNKGYYLYCRFEQAKDNSAIKELEELVSIAKTEAAKFNSALWLSFCLRDGMQYKEEITLWRSILVDLKSESLKNRTITSLAQSLVKDDKKDEAKDLLVERLLTMDDSKGKSALYNALSDTEGSIGNKTLSIYCKDKSLEFDVNNRDELFNSAYAASNENIDEISISNYIKLVRIDGDNATALNNLGVRAQDADLKIKAIENYKKSSEHDNTLAMANQGYLLLKAGFSDEAMEMANKAIELGAPHKNVYSLISAIDKAKEEQNDKWLKLQEESLDRQKEIRKYTEQYYLGTPDALEGEWLTSDTHKANFKIEKDTLKATWLEPIMAIGGADNGSYIIELEGKTSGSTFKGKYTKRRENTSPNSFLGLNEGTDKLCLGYISKNGNEIRLISSKFKDNFSLSFSKVIA
jgi:tetratricopeptide (TPR) repeat protein